MGERNDIADLPSLIAEQRRLLLEESVILDVLKKVRDEMHKLQIEQLQLDSMIMAEDGNKNVKPSNTEAKQNKSAIDMDSAEVVNQEKLDLNVTSSLSSMVQGKFFAEEEDEDEEEDEEEDDNDSQTPVREEFILSL
ncbi:snRNA-activating protein complex subunit 5-like [Periplaneta americana]|uniref:snRNA-activating protein complex subunit 5-like n=1 Tax=Periplaneta americana TaxID=6978 RepID=UPI0037E8A9E4